MAQKWPDELVATLAKVGKNQEETEGLLEKLKKGDFFDLRLDIEIAKELERQFRGHKLFYVFMWGPWGEDGSINLRFTVRPGESTIV